jgi:hypothetical protein
MEIHSCASSEIGGPPGIPRLKCKSMTSNIPSVWPLRDALSHRPKRVESGGQGAIRRPGDLRRPTECHFLCGLLNIIYPIVLVEIVRSAM